MPRDWRGSDDWTAADDAFALFLATVTAADLSEWEWRAFQWHRLHGWAGESE